jgi:hypothetical protein
LIAMAGLLAVSWSRPVAVADAGAATQFTVALFAALLTGEAVVFALAFSAASAWPSLREIDRHILFREWVLVGTVAAGAIAVGLLWNLRPVATFGALLFLGANVLGIFSFIRLFGIASVGGRSRLLARTLAAALTDPLSPSGAAVVDAYLSAVDQALSGGDQIALRELVRQLVAAGPGPHCPDAAYDVHFAVLRSLTRSVLLRDGDPESIGARIDDVIRAVIHTARFRPDADGPLGALGRQLGWTARVARTLVARGSAEPRTARQIIVLCHAARLRLARVMDPDPMSPSSADELGTPFPDPLRLLTWLRGFTEYGGAHHSMSYYGVYEILAGRKFTGDAVYGGAVLNQLREDLFGPAPLAGAAADRSRAEFGTVEEFDLFWCRLSVNAIATMNDDRFPVPPEFADPAAKHGVEEKSIELRTYATHRWFHTAPEAMSVLLRLASQSPDRDSLWERTTARQNSRGYDRVPATPVYRRPAAMVLAVACRLAPLEPEEDDVELAAFLALLPVPVLEAAARLAARVLPGADEPTDPAESIIVGLRVLLLLGRHTLAVRR